MKLRELRLLHRVKELEQFCRELSIRATKGEDRIYMLEYGIRKSIEDRLEALENSIGPSNEKLFLVEQRLAEVEKPHTHDFVITASSNIERK